MSRGCGRELAAAFSTRCIRQLAGKNHPLPWERLAAVLEHARPGDTLVGAYDTAYAVLRREYRCEYVYATALISQVAGTGEVVNTMTGLPVFMSVADLVIAGERPVVYEIKTDLDGLGRLDLQLHSYATCFEHVVVLTSPPKLNRVLAETPSHVGVSTLTEADKVVAVRAPSGGLERIQRSALFRVLRRGELLNIMGRRLGYEQDVPNTRIYHRLNGLFMQLDVETAYNEFVTELRLRDQRKRQAARDAGLPMSLQAAAAGLSLTPTAWRRLGALLRRPAEEFRPPVRNVAAG
ncbi:sce7726 family protein [Mycobacterium hackensackense]|nr:sce7726 family protein [Mycobacterium hackensackense]